MAKFLVLHPDLGKYGGGEKVCYGVIKALTTNNQQVELLTLGFDADRYRDIMGENFPADVRIHCPSRDAKVGPPFSIYKKHHVIMRMLKDFKRDLRYEFLFDTHASSPYELAFLDRGKRSIAYVHFPEIHYIYDHADIKRKAYLWPFKRWVEGGVKNLDFVFCNSNYTRRAIGRYWGKFGIQEPVVVYPPVMLNAFWCDQPLQDRKKRVCYVGRFVQGKRHDLMRRLARDLPTYEFVSIGGLADDERKWFEEFSRDLPKNYTLMTNATGEELRRTLRESRVYAHMMAGEHFGIAPVEALASGCLPLVHGSGGMVEFIPQEYHWKDYEELKQKVTKWMDSSEESAAWESKRRELWTKISSLGSDRFQSEIWSHIESLL
jgi:glycosyltransferase involved in cell wall biosynthesis